jgi:hypothetical protein
MVVEPLLAREVVPKSTLLASKMLVSVVACGS